VLLPDDIIDYHHQNTNCLIEMFQRFKNNKASALAFEAVANVDT
jgi:UTP-glucose-1-phosphate uridylyltransferase